MKNMSKKEYPSWYPRKRGHNTVEFNKPDKWYEWSAILDVIFFAIFLLIINHQTKGATFGSYIPNTAPFLLSKFSKINVQTKY